MTNVVSKEAIPSLDYLSSAFRTPAYDARISETKFEYFYPISGTKNTTCLRWTIPPNNGNYVSNMEGLILALEPRTTDREKQNPLHSILIQDLSIITVTAFFQHCEFLLIQLVF